MPFLTERGKFLRDTERLIHTLTPIYTALIGLDLTNFEEDSTTSTTSSSSSSSTDCGPPHPLKDILYGPHGLGTVLQILSASWEAVSSSRYLEREEGKNRLGMRRDRIEEILGMNERRLKVHARMNYNSFSTLTNLIRDHPVFSNNSTTPQEPVEYQLLVVLDRLGGYGNGASVGKLSTLYSMAEGTVDKWTWRVLEAISSLQRRYLAWPDAQERMALQAQTGRISSFAYAVGSVDGTHIPLHQRPGLVDANDFYTKRKRGYTLNVMAVADINRRLRFLDVGWAGSQHDQRIFDSSVIHRDPYSFFSDGQYLLADAGYLPTRFVVPTYKAPPNGRPPPDQRTFNHEHSKVRVKVEHAFGMLKMRFMSLRGVRIALNHDGDFKRVSRWIVCCAILHNFLVDEEGDDFWAGEDMRRLEELWETEAREERENRRLDDDDLQEMRDYGGRGYTLTRIMVKKAAETRGYAPAYV